MALTHAWAERSKRYFEEHKHEVPWGSESASQRVSKSAEDKSRSPSHPSEQRTLAGDPDAGMTERKANAGPSTAWLRHSAQDDKLIGKTQSLFGIVQGGMYADLRKESAERLVEMDLPGYAIGGLAVGEPREVTREMIARVLEILPKDKPRYVMGVGYPDEIEEYARMGVDMMDCVLPTRAGRHGLLFAREDGAVVRMNIKRAEFAEDGRPVDESCGCMVCRRYSRAYLRHLFSCGEPLGASLNSIHNLAFYLDTMARVRAELAGGTA